MFQLSILFFWIWKSIWEIFVAKSKFLKNQVGAIRWVSKINSGFWFRSNKASRESVILGTKNIAKECST